jgi:hypothetical protein
VYYFRFNSRVPVEELYSRSYCSTPLLHRFVLGYLPD